MNTTDLPLASARTGGLVLSVKLKASVVSESSVRLPLSVTVPDFAISKAVPVLAWTTPLPGLHPEFTATVAVPYKPSSLPKVETLLNKTLPEPSVCTPPTPEISPANPFPIVIVQGSPTVFDVFSTSSLLLVIAAAIVKFVAAMIVAVAVSDL